MVWNVWGFAWIRSDAMQQRIDKGDVRDPNGRSVPPGTDPWISIIWPNMPNDDIGRTRTPYRIRVYLTYWPHLVSSYACCLTAASPLYVSLFLIQHHNRSIEQKKRQHMERLYMAKKKLNGSKKRRGGKRNMLNAWMMESIQKATRSRTVRSKAWGFSHIWQKKRVEIEEEMTTMRGPREDGKKNDKSNCCELIGH